MKAIDDAGDELQEALAAINSFGKTKLTAEDYSKAFDTVATLIKDNEEALEKGHARTRLFGVLCSPPVGRVREAPGVVVEPCSE
eukprot:1029323-Pyramimonas_sp.AAC.1